MYVCICIHVGDNYRLVKYVDGVDDVSMRMIVIVIVIVVKNSARSSVENKGICHRRRPLNYFGSRVQ